MTKPLFPVSPVTDARRYVADLLEQKVLDYSEYSSAIVALDNLADLIADELLNDADNDDL